MLFDIMHRSKKIKMIERRTRRPSLGWSWSICLRSNMSVLCMHRTSNMRESCVWVAWQRTWMCPIKHIIAVLSRMIFFFSILWPSNQVIRDGSPFRSAHTVSRMHIWSRLSPSAYTTSTWSIDRRGPKSKQHIQGVPERSDILNCTPFSRRLFLLKAWSIFATRTSFPFLIRSLVGFYSCMI